MSVQELLYKNAYDIHSRSVTTDVITIKEPFVVDDIISKNVDVTSHANVKDLQADIATLSDATLTTATIATATITSATADDLTINNSLTAESSTIANLTVTDSLSIPDLTIEREPYSAVSVTPKSTDENVGLLLTPKGTGPLLLRGSTVLRGANAIDLQMMRTFPSEVARGQHSALIGGHSNTTEPTATNSMVLGGFRNKISGAESAVLNGIDCNVSGVGSVAIGRHVHISADGSLVASDGTTELVNGTIHNSATFKYGGGYYFRGAERFDIDDYTQRHTFHLRKEFHNTPEIFFSIDLADPAAYITITANMRSVANNQRMIKRSAFINEGLAPGELTYQDNISQALPPGALNTCGVALYKANPNTLDALAWGTGSADVYMTIVVEIHKV